MPRVAREPLTVLMCRPDHFEVVYAINPHMRDAAGRLRTVDRARALGQWNALRQAYLTIGMSVEVLPGVPGLPDMVFAANQTFPFISATGERCVLLSNMRAPERQAEVGFYAEWFTARGFRTCRLPASEVGWFEGQGDLLWHPGAARLFGGHGFRTTSRALEAISAVVGVPVTPLELVDDRFYHLDTCLMPLDAHRALIVREAFAPLALRDLDAAFETLIPVPVGEGIDGFACNAHCPDGRHVLLDAAATTTAGALAAFGFDVIALDTSEFRKAGGSVFCMKMMVP